MARAWRGDAMPPELRYSHPSRMGDVVAIMIPEPKGREVVSLLERNVTVTMTITIGTRNLQKYVSRTSVVFVSISFIVLMMSNPIPVLNRLPPPAQGRCCHWSRCCADKG